jgi:PPM family protein phosphatase
MDIPEMRAAIGTTVGEVRSGNQDRAIIARFSAPNATGRSFVACVLCDGMGGMVDGGRCAEITVASFIDYLISLSSPVSVDSVRGAVFEANDSVFRQYKGRGGTTLTALVSSTQTDGWAITVGDTRLYELPPSGPLKQLSTDDTIAGELKRIKGTDSDSQLEPFSNRLAQFVGIGEGIEPRTLVVDTTMESNYLLATDGTRIIDNVTFGRVVSASPSLQSLAVRLIHLSNWCGGEDNSSVICIPANATRAIQTTQGFNYPLLEIWDSFGKLDVVIASERYAEKPVTSAPLNSSRAYDQQFHRPSNVNAQPKGRKTPRTKSDKRSGVKSGKSVMREPADIRPAHKQLEIEIVESRPEHRPNIGTDGKGGMTSTTTQSVDDSQRKPSDHSDSK